MSQPIFPALQFTHVRRKEYPFRTYCGTTYGPSISVEHLEAVGAESEHIMRLPEPVCEECRKVYEGW